LPGTPPGHANTFARLGSWALLGLITIACFALPIYLDHFAWWAYAIATVVWLGATCAFGEGMDPGNF
jgi:hypothetical protein